MSGGDSTAGGGARDGGKSDDNGQGRSAASTGGGGLGRSGELRQPWEEQRAGGGEGDAHRPPSHRRNTLASAVEREMKAAVRLVPPGVVASVVAVT
ncbi:hypothetical protein PR202_gb17325 [Eleusine coracana subsp. coracana]|uniref:Uncharacterized protein n=1 Tax=Eleusine coracana subsp. coracana TaxID=191504 RepID=A0AAV5F474_ELECO|nr:hypothetical protein PR202_gb17325 [Eleusine coracana subsp. coracana]